MTSMEGGSKFRWLTSLSCEDCTNGVTALLKTGVLNGILLVQTSVGFLSGMVSTGTSGSKWLLSHS